MPKVSVIIPCYNYGQFLDEAVDSVLAQTFQDFEIIIVNDGSTDEFTNNLLSTYNKPKTRVLNQVNQGLGCARNNGIKVSSGEYIVCLDADDYLHPEFFSKTIPILDEDQEFQFGFVMPWVQLFGDINSVWETAEFDPFLECMHNGLHAVAPFRKECWVAAGGYNEHMITCGYEDWDFWISVAALGYKWFTVKEPLVYYRKRAGSMLEKSDEKRLLLFRQIIRKNEKFYRENYEEIIVRGLEYFEERLKMCDAAWQTRLEIANSRDHHPIELIVECQNLHLQLDNVTKELEILRTSLTWRLTAPFRAILDFLWRNKS